MWNILHLALIQQIIGVLSSFPAHQRLVCAGSNLGWKTASTMMNEYVYLCSICSVVSSSSHVIPKMDPRLQTTSTIQPSNLFTFMILHPSTRFLTSFEPPYTHCSSDAPSNSSRSSSSCRAGSSCWEKATLCQLKVQFLNIPHASEMLNGTTSYLRLW